MNLNGPSVTDVAISWYRAKLKFTKLVMSISLFKIDTRSIQSKSTMEQKLALKHEVRPLVVSN